MLLEKPKPGSRQTTTLKSLRIDNDAIEVANRIEYEIGFKLGPLASRAITWLDSLNSIDAFTLVLSGGRMSRSAEQHLAEAMIEAIRARYKLDDDPERTT